jgi:hypothetical protein
MTAQHLNALGLLLGMAGVLLIFFWGPPLPEIRNSVGIALKSASVVADGKRVADIEGGEKQLRHRHEIISRFGLGLVFFGFAAQFAALWVP